MVTVHTLDLRFQSEKCIAAFLVPTEIGPVLIETGPESTFIQLEAGVRKLGYKMEDIQHVFLTHVHLDHAGAAWKLAQHGATIYVHPVGLPHLGNPAKLWNSASRIYGDEMERLWGKINPIDPSQLNAVDEGDIIKLGSHLIKVWFTPGHAPHHNVYQLDDFIFTGDVAGVKIEGGPIQPPCPPPDIQVELWLESLQKIKKLKPTALYLSHFGRQNNALELLVSLEEMLMNWATWVKRYFDENVPVCEVMTVFDQYAQMQLIATGLESYEVLRYQYANPSFMSVLGLYRYWSLKSQNRI